MPPQPMHERPRKSHAPEDTKKRLVEAAVDLFGRYSFDGVSTRDLADRADVNLAAIQYYFGGKEGLYLAVARFIVAHSRGWLAPHITRIGKILDKNPDKETSFLLLCELFDLLMKHILLESEHMSWMGIFIREQIDPTEAFGILYQGIMKPVHDCFSRLIGQVLGTSGDEAETRAKAYATFGQLLMFHFSRAEISRSLNWEKYGTEEMELIRKVLLEQVRAILDMPEELLREHLGHPLA